MKSKLIQIQTATIKTTCIITRRIKSNINRRFGISRRHSQDCDS